MLVANRGCRWRAFPFHRHQHGAIRQIVLRKHPAPARKLKPATTTDWSSVDLSKPIAIDLTEAMSSDDKPLSLEVSRIRVRRSQETGLHKYRAIVDFGLRTPEANRVRLASTDATKILNGMPNVFLDKAATPVHSLTILKSSPEATFESLLTHLEPLAAVQLPDEPLFVFFVTRSFAAELYTRQDLLPLALSKLLGDRKSTCSSLQTLVAIVDKLPVPLVTETSDQDKRNAHRPTSDFGSEGFCVTSSSSRYFGVSSGGITNWSPESSRFLHSLGPEKPATVTCSINPFHVHILDNVLDPHSDRPLSSVDSYSIQLPLPSTIFENGLRHTLLWSRFVKETGTESYLCKSTENVQHAQVNLAFNPGLGRLRNAAIGAPLLPLTAGYRVADCKGNIVRRLQPLGEAAGTIKPASQGLENAVSEYFVQKSIRPQTLSIWALIIPRALMELTRNFDEKIRHLTEKTASTPPDLLSEEHESPPWLGSNDPSLLCHLFGKGAKLRKVTSGGGGWGNKAGLLALDPDSTYQDLAEPSETLEDNEWSKTGLKPIAQAGDYIQFFFVPPELLDHPTTQVSAARPSSLARVSRCEFGVIPSTLDQVSPSSSPTASTADSTAPPVYHNRFGALSEKGIAVQIQSYSGWGQALQSSRTETKVDVPFARFSTKTKSNKNREVIRESSDHADENMLDSIGAAVKGSMTTKSLGFQPTQPRRTRIENPVKLRLRHNRLVRNIPPRQLCRVQADPNFAAAKLYIRRSSTEHSIRTFSSSSFRSSCKGEDCANKANTAGSHSRRSDKAKPIRNEMRDVVKAQDESTGEQSKALTDSRAVTIRYSNQATYYKAPPSTKSDSSVDGSAIKPGATIRAYRRTVPKPFRDGESSSREKAWKLSRHPAATKPAKFFKKSGHFRRPFIFAGDEKREQTLANVSAEEYFWAPSVNRINAKTQATDQSTQEPRQDDKDLALKIKEARRRRLEAVDLERGSKRSWDDLVTQVQETSEREHEEKPLQPRNITNSSRLTKRVKEFIQSSQNTSDRQQ